MILYHTNDQSTTCEVKFIEQREIVNNKASEWSFVYSSVPQGRVLRPTLFLCYISDLPRHINNVFELFADDIKLFAKLDSVLDCESLQNDLNTIYKWSHKWKLNSHLQNQMC